MTLRSLRSLFCDTWKLYKERWSVLVEIVLLPVLVMVLGYVLKGLDLGYFSPLLGTLIILVGWIGFLFSVFTIIFSIHHATGVDASYKEAIKWFWPFVWLTVLEVLAVAGGFVMLIIPGIWLAFSFSFVAYGFVIEHRRGIDALRQSKEYVKGYWWAVLGRILLLGLILFVVELIVRFLAAFLGGSIGASIAYLALLTFTVPFSVIYSYVIFKNLRELKPDLAEMRTEKGKGFIKASAIVGVVAFVLILLGLVLFAGAGSIHGLRHVDRYPSPPPGYGMQGSLQQ